MLVRSFAVASQTITGRVGEVFRAHGLSHAAGNALAVIEGARRALTPGEIGAEMHTTSGSITSIVDTLEKKGLVHRAAHADDRRKVLVEVTPAGEALLDEILPEVHALTNALMANLSQRDQATLVRLINRAIASADAVDTLPPALAPRQTPWRNDER